MHKLLGRRVRVHLRTVSERYGTVVLPVWGNLIGIDGALLYLANVVECNDTGDYRSLGDLSVDTSDEDMFVDIVPVATVRS